MDSVTITIPGAPKGKGRPRATRRGVMYTPAETRSREGVVAALAMQAMNGRHAFCGPVAMDVRVVCPIPKSWPKKRQAAALVGAELPTGKPDLDNVLKLVLDGLNGIAFADDAQVVAFGELRKVYGPQPVTVVTVRPIGVPEDVAPFQRIGDVAARVVADAAARMQGE
jgi:Holliday junction resolvase RusA-like endonuclease